MIDLRTRLHQAHEGFGGIDGLGEVIEGMHDISSDDAGSAV